MWDLFVFKYANGTRGLVSVVCHKNELVFFLLLKWSIILIF